MRNYSNPIAMALSQRARPQTGSFGSAMQKPTVQPQGVLAGPIRNQVRNQIQPDGIGRQGAKGGPMRQPQLGRKGGPVQTPAPWQGVPSQVMNRIR